LQKALDDYTDSGGTRNNFDISATLTPYDDDDDEVKPHYTQAVFHYSTAAISDSQTWSSPFTPSTVSICPAADSSVPSSP